MTRWVALLRAVNVGGTGRLAMSDLAAACHDGGFEHVRTHLASGNAVFSSDHSAETIRSALEAALSRRCGQTFNALIRSGEAVCAVAAANPFADQPANTVYALFLPHQPSADWRSAIRWQAGEQIAEGPADTLFIAYPDGQGRSKLVLPLAKIGTMRNMNTVAALANLAMTG